MDHSKTGGFREKLANFFQAQSSSPLEKLTEKKGCSIYIKRDDLLAIEREDPFCGNKWRKLKYNLIDAAENQKDTLLTFGGAYSNHLAASASAGKHLGFKTIGIVRGGPFKALNPTLSFARECGMNLHYVTRSDYRRKEEESFLESLKKQFGDFYLLPEGGSNYLAVQGCQELVDEIRNQLGRLPDYLAVSCGTGGTFAGIINGMKGQGTLIGVSALKGISFEKDMADKWKVKHYNWNIFNNYNFGGYAKHTPEQINFINHFKQTFHIGLDRIYTGKLFWGIFDLLDRGFFPEGSELVLIHTGGLQGIKGFNERFGDLLEE